MTDVQDDAVFVSAGPNVQANNAPSAHVLPAQPSLLSALSLAGSLKPRFGNDAPTAVDLGNALVPMSDVDDPPSVAEPGQNNTSPLQSAAVSSNGGVAMDENE
jgi:hypothetical protein